MTWTLLSIGALVALVLTFNRKTSTWGGATIGAVIGLVVAFATGFSWWVVMKYAVVGTFIGVVAELFGVISDKLRNNVEDKRHEREKTE